jgi:hypothetical protein
MAKKKKKFPDLTGDGKVTKADILKGRGVIESDDFISEVMSRVEENILLEDEFFKMLEGLEEKGYDVESLTEEELNEFFYKLRKGLKKASGGRFDFTTAKEDRRERAQKKRDKRRVKRSMANAEEYSAKRGAAKKAAAEKAAAAEKPKDKAVTTLATKGSGEEEKSAGGKPTRAALKQQTDRRLSQVKNAETAHANNPYAQQSQKLAKKPDHNSTDIVRGARMGLAERVLKKMKP